MVAAPSTANTGPTHRGTGRMSGEPLAELSSDVMGTACTTVIRGGRPVRVATSPGARATADPPRKAARPTQATHGSGRDPRSDGPAAPIGELAAGRVCPG